MAVKKTHEEFLQQTSNLLGQEYTVKGSYNNSRTKIEVVHNTCGKTFEVTPNNLLKGRGCSNCYIRRKLSQEEYEKRVFDLVGDEYLPLDDYKNYTTPLCMKHHTCGCVYKVTPANFIFNNRRCPKCFKSTLKTQEEFRKELFTHVGDEYTLVGKYIGNKEKVGILHNTCGTTYKAIPINFLRGARCPKCMAEGVSKGEKRVSLFLEKNKVRYEREVSFPDCRNIYPLRYDFSIQTNKGELLFLIEFDGIQHFLPTRGEEALTKQQDNDAIKDRYCKSKGLKLVRIAYTEFDSIEEIITKELKKEGVEIYEDKKYIRDTIESD